MNILFTIIAALPIGFLVRQRSTAVVAYLAADALLFSYQNVDVMLNWMAGNGGIGGAQAFGPFPTEFPIPYAASDIVGYGLVNLIIVVVGIGLTLLGNWIRSRRSSRAASTVSVG